RSTLPIRRPPFKGVVKETLDGSQPDWDHVAPIRAPDGAPNVLLVLTDDAGGVDDRTQSPCRRLRHGRGVRRAVPRLHGDDPEGLPAVREDAAGQRLLDRVLRQVAPDAGQPAGTRRPVRSLAERARLRLLLG